jgi:hypothetical protein
MRTLKQIGRFIKWIAIVIAISAVALVVVTAAIGLYSGILTL